MIRTAIAIYAFGLLAYPLWCLVALDDYRVELEDLYGAAEATVAQLQMAAGIHWLKNAYLAYAFLLLARYVGRPEKPNDVWRAGALLMGFPVVELAYQFLAQVAMARDPEDLDVNIQLSTDFLVYFMLGLCLIGIARTLADQTADNTGP
jgi:hypothetical protein